MGTRRRVKLGSAAVVAAPCLIAILCYLNTLGNQLVFDDVDIIARNPLVTGEGGGLARIFTSHYWQHVAPAGNLYRPLTIASYALNHRLGGLEPAGFHLVNLLLHALVSGLVAALGRRIGMGDGAAMAAGALFAAHPIHTEAVAGIVGRAELLAAAAVLGAWLVHLSIDRGERRAGRLAAIAALFLAGLLSKENAVVLPALMLAGDVRRHRLGTIRWNDALPSWLVCGVTVAAWLGLRAALLSPVPAGSITDTLFAGVPFGVRVWTALTVLARYLRLLVWPVDLSADYSFEQIPLALSPAEPLVVAGLAVCAAIAVPGLLRLVHGAAADQSGLLAAGFLVALAPVSNVLVPIGTIMGERLLYLPSVFFCLALPWGWRALRGALRSGADGWAGPALAAVLTILYAARTIDRNTDWKDQLTLFSATTLTSPRSAKAHYNLGVALEEAGRETEALQEYERAIAIRPDDARSLHNAGLILARRSRTAEAAALLEKAAAADPNVPQVFTNLGVAYTRMDRPADAERAFLRALERNPADATASYNLGTLRLMSGDAAGAVGPLRAARDLEPRDPDKRYQLGLALREAGRHREAIDELREALALSPGLAGAHVEMGLAFLSLGMREEARAEALAARAAGVALPEALSSELDRR